MEENKVLSEVNSDVSADSQETKKSGGRTFIIASSNAFIFSLTMLFALLIYSLMVMFIVPVEWLIDSQWQVFPSLGLLLYMLCVCLAFFPLVLIFQLMIAGLVKNFKKYTWQMEAGGLAMAFLLGGLFFWPGYLQ